MICVLTYDAPHRKTQDLLWRLKLHGYDYVAVVGSPWVERKQHLPLVGHRPGSHGWPVEALPFTPYEVCMRLGYSYAVVPSSDLLQALHDRAPETVIVGGAGILPAEIVKTFDVLNVHSGLLPRCRGLDSLKWAVYYGLPIGVTAHLCDEKADAGRFVARSKNDIHYGDTFHSLAMRHYEMEMDLHITALDVLELARSHPDLRGLPLIDVGDNPVYKRMGRKKQSEMLRRFAARNAGEAA